MVAEFYALIVAFVIYRELDLLTLRLVLRRTVTGSTVIMFIIAAAGLFGFLFNRSGAPAAATSWLIEMLDDPLAFLIGVNAFLLVIGMFIEREAAIIVLAPVLTPVAVAFGIDPANFGIIMVIKLAPGFITPPFGVNLFAASNVAGMSVDSIYRAVLPSFWRCLRPSSSSPSCRN